MDFNIITVDVTDSTNEHLKRLAADGADDFTCLFARSQTSGKGRRGRCFHSPDGGIYMSILLKKLPPSSELLITTAAALALRRAILGVFGVDCGIKWVNDLYFRGKKVCGILAESVIFGDEKFTVVGIGINVTTPQGGFAKDIKDIAGAISERADDEQKNRLVTAILNEFYEIYAHLPDNGFIDEYRRHSILIGRRVFRISGDDARECEVLDIDSLGGLRVRYDGGEEEVLRTGEVSIKIV